MRNASAWSGNEGMRWFSRNTVCDVTVYLLMRIARSTPGLADEPIYLFPRSTGPNRKPRSRRPHRSAAGEHARRSHTHVCARDVSSGYIPANSGFSRRELCSTSKRRNGIPAMPQQRLQFLGPFVDPNQHSCPGSTATAMLPSLSCTARFRPYRGITLATSAWPWEVGQLDSTDSSAGSSQNPQTPSTNLPTATRCSAGGWWFSWHLPSQIPSPWPMSQNRTTSVGRPFLRGSLGPIQTSLQKVFFKWAGGACVCFPRNR